MAEALVTPAVLQWARERRELTPEILASRLKNVDPKEVESWERGEARPSITQAERMAHEFRVPLGYLYLSRPPRLKTPIPDLRTVSLEHPGLSLDLRQVVNDALVKQDWYREFLLEREAESLGFVGRFSSEDDDPRLVAQDIKRVLKLRSKDRHGNVDDYRRLIIERIEAAGVSVLRSGIVGSNTKRTLDVRECRGFALPDDLAPLIFVNSRDADTAQVFTLVHELSHIWFGVSGISNFDSDEPQSANRKIELERTCNEIAARVLLPEVAVRRVWSHGTSHEDAVRRVSAEFRVSRMASLVRAYNLYLVSRDEFKVVARKFESFSPFKPKGRGGNAYHTLRTRNGKRLTSALVASVVEGRIPATTASAMLGVSEVVVRKAAVQYGIL